MLEQVYASRVENVNPFLIAYYDGEVMLVPDSDTWVDTKKIDASIIFDTAEYELALLKHGADAKTGLSEVEWGAWQTDWVGEVVGDVYTEVISEENLGKVKPKSKKVKGADMSKIQHIPNGKMTKKHNGKWMPKGKGVIIDAVLTTKQDYQDTEITTKMSKEGTQ